MRIPSASTDRKIAFVAVDATDLKTRVTALSGFVVYRSREGGAATIYTTPTVAELSAANMPGVYVLTIDEDTTLTAGHDTEEYIVHITVATMAPVTRSLEIYRPKFTEGQSGTMANNAVDADIERLQGSLIATPTVAGVLEVDVTHWIGTAAATPTVAGVPEVDVTHWIGTAAATPTVAGVPEVDLTHVAGITTNVAALATNVDAIKAKTDNLPTDPADQSLIIAATDAIISDTNDIQTRLPAALVGGRIDASVGAVAANTITAAALAADAGTELADALLARDIGSGSGAGALDERTVRAALRFLRNKWTVSGGVLTVKKEDDTADAWTSAMTGTVGADPITGSDPT